MRRNGVERYYADELVVGREPGANPWRRPTAPATLAHLGRVGLEILMFRTTLAAASLLAVTVTAAHALTITGTAEAIDSDLFLLDGYRVYLVGVESVEAAQGCLIGNQTWECYPAAVRQLQTILAEGTVICEVMSGPNFLNQVIAACTVNGEDIGERMVRTGYALTIPAESEAYAAALAAAQAAGVGFWQGMVAQPSEWRAANGILADRPAFRPVAP